MDKSMSPNGHKSMVASIHNTGAMLPVGITAFAMLASKEWQYRLLSLFVKFVTYGKNACNSKIRF
jgi:hypothetical protein